MNEIESRYPQNQQDHDLLEPPRRSKSPKSPYTIAGSLYWQVLAALFGCVISLGFQVLLGIYLLLDVFCGAQSTDIEFLRCSEMTLRSTFLVSLAFTSSFGAAIGASFVAWFHKQKGSFLFSWLVCYLFFAFFAMLQESYFLDLWGGGGQASAYWLAAVATSGGLVASVAFHIPKWLLAQSGNSHARPLNEQS